MRRLVGEGFFAYAADRYLRVHPPAGPCLAEYGGTFADFLRAFEPARSLRYLPDVARLEWAMAVALHAEEADPIAPAALAAVPPEETARARLGLHPSAGYLSSPWPVDRIWRANQPEHDSPPPVDLDAGSVCLEIRRIGDDVVWRSLDPGTHELRARLAEGRTLEAAAHAALAADPTFDLAAGLRALFTDQLVTGLSRSPLAEE